MGVLHADQTALDHAGAAPVGVLPAHVPGENAPAEVKLQLMLQDPVFLHVEP